MQQSIVKVLCENNPEGMEKIDWEELEMKVVATIRFCLKDNVIYRVMNEESSVIV